MTKTLADMTVEERANCRGMWCDTAFGLGILEAIEEHPEEGDAFCRFQHPATGKWHTEGFTTVTLRFDLPRAWTPDGQPVPGEWEDGHVVVSYDDPDPWILKDAVSIEGLSEGGMSYYDAPPNGIEVKLDKFGEGEGKARRWVGSWEQA